MKSSELLKTLEKAGWVKLPGRGKGSHTMMKHPDKAHKLSIPKGEIKPGTLAQILKAAGLK
ncbi:MAG: hypothetical protein PWQ57_2007 [Desulfovibrionales bacterium]|nr:hypothetical protein [Desulfovibrionales bacterium]